jgi:hypothetical protein
VSGGEDYDMINGADAGMLDEEAERRAFQEAVMAWRTGGETTEKGGKTISLTGLVKAEGGEGTDDGMWSNPFGDNVDSEVGLGLYDEKEIIVSARGVRSEEPVRTHKHNEGRQSGGRNLGEGSIDEEKEQAVGISSSSSTRSLYYPCETKQRSHFLYYVFYVSILSSKAY